MLIGSVVEASRGNFGGEPIGFGETDGEWDEVLLDLLLGQLFADLVQRFHGLHVSVSLRARVSLTTYLVSHKGLLDGSKILQG